MKKLDQIISIINETKYPILSYREYENMITSIKNIWGYKTMPRSEIKSKLVKKDLIKIEKIFNEKDKLYTFFKKNGASVDIFDLASTRSRSSYFSYYSAIYLNSLTLQIPKQIFLTLERKYDPNNVSSKEISQEIIDKAFATPPRITNNKRYYKNCSVNLIHGQGQNNIGVTTFREIYKVSDIVRTLIDASVRPFYCGGVTQVLEAFIKAKNKLNIDKLFNYYSQMNFIYPYHNIIGFYLEHSGYNKSEIDSFKKIKDNSKKIYLTYNMHNPILSKEWNIFYPKGLI